MIKNEKDRKVTRNVPVLSANQVRVYIAILMMVCNTNSAWIQEHGHWVAMDFTKEGGYLFDSFGRFPSYFGFEHFMNENCATWMYNDVKQQTPESNACGYHVITFYLSHYDYISMFSDNLTLNDFFVRKWLELAVHLY